MKFESRLSLVISLFAVSLSNAAMAQATAPADISGTQASGDTVVAGPVDPLAQTEPTPVENETPAAADSQTGAASADAASGGETLATIPVNTPEPATPVAENTPVHNRVIEEIVVTAQKREDKLQDVPIAIQAFSDDSLSARNIGATDQLGQLVPSLHFTQAAGYTLIYLRGIGTSQFVPSADPSIATYVDGIYVPQGQAGTQSLGGIKRVEVLKGPQGTLFGRNTIGGAINVITESPGNEFKASAEASYTSLDHSFATATVSGPITNWLSASLSGAYGRDESYIKATTFDVPVGYTRTVRAKLSMTPTDNLTIDLTGYYSGQDNVNLSIGQNSKPKLLGTATLVTNQGDDYTVSTDLPAQSKSNQQLVYAVADWDLPWLDLKFLGSAQEVNIPRYDYDFDGSPLPLIGFDTARKFTNLKGEYSHLQSAELQFVSNDGSWLADRFKWVGGLYYFHSIGAFDPARFHVAPNLLSSGLDIVGNLLNIPLTLPEGLQNLFSEASDKLNLANAPGGQDGISLSLSGVLETDSYSAYAQGTYSLTDWLDLTLGGRFQQEHRYLTKSETNVYDPVNGGLLPLLKFPLQGQHETNFSPKAQFSIRPRENTMIYVSYGEGYKSGTYNIVAIYAAPKYIVPEHVRSYEIGAKADFFSGKLRLNTAAFYNKIDHLQDGFVSLLSGGAVSFNTAKGARTRGVEFDLTSLPIPNWDPGLVFTANAAYVDAIYTSFTNGEGFDATTGLYSSNLDLSGYRLRNTPKFSGSVGLVQTIPVDNGTVEVGLDEYYTSRFYYNANNTVSENPYTVTNAHVSYEYEPWGLRMTLFGQNLLNERYHIQQFETDFGLLTTLAPPRQIGIRLSWQL